MVVDSEEYFPRGKAPPAVAKADGGRGGDSGKGTKGEGREASQAGEQDGKFVHCTFNTEEKPKKNVKKSKNKLTPGEEKTLAGNRRGVEEKKFSVVPLTYDVQLLKIIIHYTMKITR
ncbi:unnamed protein product [Orchesella dallaii]|uniref:Uncharacterized protein n=1 Tax=Orchesella dallaii TaxID=48710 RepID=A0ABP1RQQ9_9HEXA